MPRPTENHGLSAARGSNKKGGRKDPGTLLRVGVIGTVLVALCCFTPILVILLAAVGLAALTGYLDVVLFPALAAFIGLSVYALYSKRQRDAGSHKE
ncbi:mercury resistance system transport protein MerF [Halomonas sp. M4R5S39]|uniref:mercury resistance system transport protein MerF n=1 Tax=Halomonas kalidii TaxID=3043293 RepID=UPI0024A9FF10|nr:mercury resistance system transport protein MerF [Halomonas kalidii]MDI5985912.1 mercury resistance system transport protein MerF [Halomonas kalidii]